MAFNKSSPTTTGCEERRLDFRCFVLVFSLRPPTSLEEMLDMEMSCIPFGSCIMDDDGVVRESSIISDNVDTQSFRSAAADGTGACSSAWEKVVVVVVDGAGGFTDVVRCEAERAMFFFGAISWLTTIVPLKLYYNWM